MLILEFNLELRTQIWNYHINQWMIFDEFI